jgi:hypothetical protein
MSKTLDENWEYLGRLHQQFLEDPSYILWLEEQCELSPILRKQVEKWDTTVQKDPDGHSSLPF